MRRVIVFGPPGSGKSTVAKQIGAAFGLPVFHLDQFYFHPGWVMRDWDDFREDVERLAEGPEWVIDGNYFATMAPRLMAADTLIYIDLPIWLCLLRVVRRSLAGLGRVRPDSAPGCPERIDLGFYRFVAIWNRLRRDRNYALIERFQGRTIIVRTRAEQLGLLDRLG
jgi:hypothetical protein